MKVFALALLASAIALGSTTGLVAASPLAPRSISSPAAIEDVYYHHGHYYRYRNHGHYYRYHHNGHYYNHRSRRNGVWHYY